MSIVTDEEIVSAIKSKTPLHFNKPYFRVHPHHSWWMSCDGVISFNGRIDASFEIESKETLRGFRGDALLQFKDADGNVLWCLDTPSWGVGAGAELAASYRKEWIHESIPFEILYYTAHVECFFRENTDGSGWSQFVTNLDKARHDIDVALGGNGDGSKIKNVMELWLKSSD